jgi:cytochrome P450
VLSDYATFSSGVPAPRNWFIFHDPPGHTKMRALISRAFTPSVVADLEPSIRELSCSLLDGVVNNGRMDLALDYAVPLPMKVISRLIGIPSSDWIQFRSWSDTILRLSYARLGGEEAEKSTRDFAQVTSEMSCYLEQLSEERRRKPQEDLLSRLLSAEVEGQRLRPEEILGFVQLLVVAGQETTANLINNAILCLTENPAELVLLQKEPERMGSAIEEVLRFRSPLQWMMRTPRQDVEIHGQLIPQGELVLPMIGSANRDPKQFSNAERFDISREPNPHLAFGHGIHACLGAALARLETRIALSHLLSRLKNLKVECGVEWQPRKALHVHGPASLPVRFELH